MQKLIENLKFKKITKSEKLFLSGDLVSNRIWVLNSQWLLNLPKTRTLGLTSLVNSVTREKVALVKSRLEGTAERPKSRLEDIFNSIKLKEYREISREKLIFNNGYYTGEYDKKGLTYLSFKTKNTPNLNSCYAASLFFDLKTRIFIGLDMSPILLVNEKNEIVFAVSPLNSKILKEKGRY